MHCKTMRHVRLTHDLGLPDMQLPSFRPLFRNQRKLNQLQNIVGENLTVQVGHRERSDVIQVRMT